MCKVSLLKKTVKGLQIACLSLSICGAGFLPVSAAEVVDDSEEVYVLDESFEDTEEDENFEGDWGEEWDESYEDDEDEDDEDEDDDEDADDDEDEDDDEDAEPEVVATVRVSGINFSASTGRKPVYTAKTSASSQVSIAYEGWVCEDGCVNYSVPGMYHEDDDTFTKFTADKSYTYKICLNAKKGYCFTESTRVTINGQNYWAKLSRDGSRLYINDVYTEKSACTEHVYKKEVHELSCTEDGYTLKTCKYCGYSYTENFKPRTGHATPTEDDMDITPATLKTDGSVVTTCSECEEVIKTEVIPRVTSVSLSASSYTYDGKEKKPAVIIKDRTGKTLNASCYSVEYEDNKNAGTATAYIHFEDERYEIDDMERTFKINQAAQSISVKVASKTYKVSTTKKASQSFSIGASAKTSLSYTSSKTKYVTVSKAGKVTVKKGTPKGSYTIKVSAKNAGNFKAASRNVTIKVS